MKQSESNADGESIDYICIAAITTDNLADGPGVRTCVYCQGCDLHCKGCHNQHLWEPNGGTSMNINELTNKLLHLSSNRKITITGGEPLFQKVAVAKLCKELYNNGFHIVFYTGHDETEVPQEIMTHIHCLKSGYFDYKQKTTTIPFVGSTNQQFRQIK